MQHGTTRRLVFLFAHDGERRPATGLALEQATAAYVRTGGAAHALSLSVGAGTEWRSGGIGEVDPDLVPGVLAFGVPDEVLAAGATEAVLVVRVPGATVDPVKFNLVAYDPQDGWSLGMEDLQDHKRHKVLRRALPRFTEMELALGESGERQLEDRLGAVPPERRDST